MAVRGRGDGVQAGSCREMVTCKVQMPSNAPLRARTMPVAVFLSDRTTWLASCKALAGQRSALKASNELKLIFQETARALCAIVEPARISKLAWRRPMPKKKRGYLL